MRRATVAVLVVALLAAGFGVYMMVSHGAGAQPSGPGWKIGSGHLTRPAGPAERDKEPQPMLPLPKTEGFEGTWPGDWALYGNPTWGPETCNKHSGAKSGWVARGGTSGLPGCVNNYPNDMNGWMVYGPFDLSGKSAAGVNFWFDLDSELDWDRFWVMASGDDLDYYGMYFTGDFGGWRNDYPFDLSPWLGDSSVWFAFSFDSDSIVPDVGAFVDDIEIWSTAAGPSGCTISGPLTVVARDLPEAAPTSEGPPRLIPRLAPEKPADGAASVPETNVVDGTTTRPLQALAPPEIPYAFDGVDFNDNAVGLSPPDPQLAVGPNHVFEMVNITGRIFTKSGSVVDTFPLATFFAVPVGWFDFDPKVIYDDLGDRWFASYASILDNPTGTDYGRLHLAVSQTSDPTGAWNVYSCEYSDGNFPDYPGIGVTDDKFTVSANMFDIDSPFDLFGGVQTIVVQKSDVMAGDPTPGVYQFPYNLNRFTVRPAHSLSLTNDQYLAWFDAFSLTLLDYSRITGTPNAGNVTEQAQVSKTILSQDSPPPSLTAGSGQIDSGDSRLLEAIWRDGRLWVSGSARCRPSGDASDRSCAHLVEVNTAGAGTVVNDIMFGASGEYFSWPAIRTDSQGNLHVSLTHTTPSIWAEARVAGRLATDPPNTMSGSALLRAGEVLHDSGRWGDYMGAAVDPADPSYVWVVGQYAKDTGSSGPTGNWDWGTYIGALKFECQPAVDSDGDDFDNDVECYVGTDPLDACRDNPSDDAWPPDIKIDGQVNILDVVKFIGPLQPGAPYDRRYDLKIDESINVLDVITLKPYIWAVCTNP